ncbi:hypothetical protein Trydic_g7219 [Trypoxylus dichotomus]
MVWIRDDLGELEDHDIQIVTPPPLKELFGGGDASQKAISVIRGIRAVEFNKPSPDSAHTLHARPNLNYFILADYIHVTGDTSENPPLRKKKPSGAEKRKCKAARVKAIREAGEAKRGISQRQHKAVRKTSMAQPGTTQKHKKAIREAPKAQPATSYSKATAVKRNLSDGSTPSAPVRRPRTNTETLTDIRMAIVPENYAESSISQEQA